MLMEQEHRIMSYSSNPLAEAEPPYGEQPPCPEDELTLDLAAPDLDQRTPVATETRLAAVEAATLQETDDQPDEAEETLDLSGLTQPTLVGCELQNGKYQVLALRATPMTGFSQQGATYAALHTDLQRRLTLRYLPLDPRATEDERAQTTAQFLREVRVLAKLSHPSLPRVHDYFCESEACYVVMDELSERTLADVLAEAAQAGYVPALPPAMIAQIGLELVRALNYLHQQRPPLVLGKLTAEDVALPAEGPAQLMSLSALSIVASASSGSLPGLASLPTLAIADSPTEPSALAAGEAAQPPQADDDLYYLGVLLRDLSGGAEVVARVMERLQRPDEVLLAEGADDAPPISLALAGVIQIAAHSEPGRRFQNAAAFENALARAWLVESRIARQAEHGWRDERATLLENGEDDLAGTSLDFEPLEARQHREVATRNFSLPEVTSPVLSPAPCWRCGGHNDSGALVCRVCGARQPVAGDQHAPVSPRSQARTTHKLPPEVDESSWNTWDEEVTEDGLLHQRPTRPINTWLTPEEKQTRARYRSQPLPSSHRADERRLLWGLVWLCFIMAFVLGSTSVIITYLALH
jgi:ribosomal protein L40E